MATLLSPPVPRQQTGALPVDEMPPARPGTPAADVPADVTLYRLSVEQYGRMVEHGILTDEDPVELLEGLLVQKMTKHPPHVVSGKLAAIALGRFIPATCHIATQDPFTATTSAPEPDVSVVRGSPRDYLSRHPVPQDLALVVEVADSSVGRDRGLKRRVYARAGVPVYWIVVLPDRAVEVYTDPSGPTDAPAYATARRFADGESVPVVIDGREVGTVAVVDLLP